MRLTWRDGLATLLVAAAAALYALWAAGAAHLRRARRGVLRAVPAGIGSSDRRCAVGCRWCDGALSPAS
jgi:hypothetical protein